MTVMMSLRIIGATKVPHLQAQSHNRRLKMAEKKDIPFEDIARARHALHEREAMMRGGEHNSVEHQLGEAQDAAKELKVKMAAHTGVAVPPSPTLPGHTTPPDATDPTSNIKAASPTEHAPAPSPQARSGKVRVPSGIILCTLHTTGEDALEPSPSDPDLDQADAPPLAGPRCLPHGHPPAAFNPQPAREIDNALEAALAGAAGLEGGHEGHTFHPMTAAQHIPEVTHPPVSPHHMLQQPTTHPRASATTAASLAGLFLAPFRASAGGPVKPHIGSDDQPPDIDTGPEKPLAGINIHDESEKVDKAPMRRTMAPAPPGSKDIPGIGKVNAPPASNIISDMKPGQVRVDQLPDTFAKVGESLGGAVQHVVEKTQEAVGAAMSPGKTYMNMTQKDTPPRGPEKEDFFAPSGDDLRPGAEMSEYRRERLNAMLEDPNPALRKETLIDKIIHPFARDAKNPDNAIAIARSYYDYVDEKKREAGLEGDVTEYNPIDLQNTEHAENAATRARYTHKEVARTDLGPATTKHHLYMGAKEEMSEPEGADKARALVGRISGAAPGASGEIRNPRAEGINPQRKPLGLQHEHVGASTKPAKNTPMPGSRTGEGEGGIRHEGGTRDEGEVEESESSGHGSDVSEKVSDAVGITGDVVTDTVYTIGRTVIDTTKALLNSVGEVLMPHGEGKGREEQVKGQGEREEKEGHPMEGLHVDKGAGVVSAMGSGGTVEQRGLIEEEGKGAPASPGHTSGNTPGVIDSIKATVETLIGGVIHPHHDESETVKHDMPEEAGAGLPKRHSRHHAPLPGLHFQDLGGFGRGVTGEPHGVTSEEHHTIPEVPYTSTEELLLRKQQQREGSERRS